MLSGLLLVGLLAAYVAVCWRAPARALTEPDQRPGNFANGVRLDLPRLGRSGSVSVRYHGRTARQWAMRYKRRTRQYQTVRRTLMASSSVTEAINLACSVYGNCPTLWRKARCESQLNPNAHNPSEASGLFQFLPSTWARTPFGSFSIFSPYASALAAGWMHSVGRGGEWVCR